VHPDFFRLLVQSKIEASEIKTSVALRACIKFGHSVSLAISGNVPELAREVYDGHAAAVNGNSARASG